MAGPRVVTDSSCDLPADLVAELDIDIVPLTIRFGAEELVDRRDLSPKEFWARCTTSPVLPETSAPSAGAFEDAYRRREGGRAGGGGGVTSSPSLPPPPNYAHAHATSHARETATRAASPSS